MTDNERPLPKVPPPPPRQPGTPNLELLLRTFPPKHSDTHRPKRRKVNTTTQLVLDRLPNQGTVTDWKDDIPIGAPTPGIWAEPNHRGMAIAKSAKERSKKGKKG